MAETELLVTMPVVNPDTGKRSRTFQYMGRLDGMEEPIVIEIKATADPSMYMFRRTLSYQPELYAMAARYGGYNVMMIEYRMIVPPQIRLCSKDKSQDDYEQRCYEWIMDRPDDRLVTHRVTLSIGRTEAARRYLWACGQRILVNRRTCVWIPNGSACDEWSRVCPYKRLCEAASDGADPETLIDSEYEIVSNSHPEVGSYGADSGVLTYTGCTVLAQCEQKYFWMFERNLRRPREDTDARWLGSAVHAGLDGFARGGLEQGRAAIDQWADANPILGPEAADKQIQDIAKARAMVRAASEKWGCR